MPAILDHGLYLHLLKNNKVIIKILRLTKLRPNPDPMPHKIQVDLKARL